MTWQATDFPYAGIIQIRWYGYFSAFTRKGTPSQIKQNQKLAINVPLIPVLDHASGKPKTQP
jgi:hypothetical protein